MKKRWPHLVQSRQRYHDPVPPTRHRDQSGRRHGLCFSRDGGAGPASLVSQLADALNATASVAQSGQDG